jgi:hypothetical protein
MSKAAELAALIGSQSSLSNRNLIINGAMQVAQRGTSSTGITSAVYHTVDRNKLQVNTAGTWTATQSSTAPSGFTKSLKYDCTVADASLASGDYVFSSYTFEGQDLQHLNYGTSSAKKITISFYVRSNKTGTYTFEAQIYDGSNYYRNGKTYTINSADTWEYKTITIDGNTSNSITNTNTEGMTLLWWLAAGTDFTSGTFNNGTWTTNNTERVANTVNLADSASNEWLITGVQLEVGEQATPFEHRSYGDELRRCMRYYEKSYLDTQYFMNGSSGAQVQRQTNYYQVQKRASATLTQTATHADGSATVGNVGGNIDGITHSFGGADNNRVAFSWTADAEL